VTRLARKFCGVTVVTGFCCITAWFFGKPVSSLELLDTLFKPTLCVDTTQAGQSGMGWVEWFNFKGCITNISSTFTTEHTTLVYVGGLAFVVGFVCSLGWLFLNRRVSQSGDRGLSPRVDANIGGLSGVKKVPGFSGLTAEEVNREFFIMNELQVHPRLKKIGVGEYAFFVPFGEIFEGSLGLRKEDLDLYLFFLKEGYSLDRIAVLPIRNFRIFYLIKPKYPFFGLRKEVEVAFESKHLEP
jgi:hypothetical protein